LFKSSIALAMGSVGPWRIGLEWGFPTSGAADTAYIQQSATPGGSEETARALGLFAYPLE
ncbi:hypothetical protein, partial [Morganella morganii]|uniref:hypothetical protein n=1 Tax=Morganella morganii TaxID=582 RepID=UPI001952F543